MFNSLKNIFCSKKYEQLPKMPSFEEMNIDEKAFYAGNKFRQYLIEKCDFDEVDFFIEDPRYPSFESPAFQSLTKLGMFTEVNNEFELKKEFLKWTTLCSNDKRLITFNIYRKYGVLYESKIMVGIIRDDNILYFANHHCSPMFKDIKFDGYIKGEPEKLETYSYSIYDCLKDDFSSYIEFLLENKYDKLKFRNAAMNYYPYERAYHLVFKFPRLEQNEIGEVQSTISYNNIVLRKIDFKMFIFNNYEIENAIQRMIFPFNLNLEDREKLGIERLTIDQLSNTFEEEFLLKHMTEI